MFIMKIRAESGVGGINEKCGGIPVLREGYFFRYFLIGMIMGRIGMIILKIGTIIT